MGSLNLATIGFTGEARDQRRYKLTIQDPQGNRLVVNYPFTLRFNVNRDTLASVNRIELDLVDLSESSREFLYKDRYNTIQYWQMTLELGYLTRNKDDERLYEVYAGNIYEAYSYRDKEHWYTHVTGFDGIYGLQNARTSFTLGAGSTRLNMLQNVIGAMPNIKRGILGAPTDGTYVRGFSFSGATVDLIKQETGGKFFIDGQVLHILDDAEVIDSNYVISLDGAYNKTTPKRRDAVLEVDMFLTPELRVAELVNLDSKVDIYDSNSRSRTDPTKYNGYYKILGITHSGVISGAEQGDATTTVMLYKGSEPFRRLSV